MSTIMACYDTWVPTTVCCTLFYLNACRHHYRHIGACSGKSPQEIFFQGDKSQRQWPILCGNISRASVQCSYPLLHCHKPTFGRKLLELWTGRCCGRKDFVAVKIDSVNSRRVLQPILCRPCVYGVKIATSMLITPPSTANVVRRRRKPFQ